MKPVKTKPRHCLMFSFLEVLEINSRAVHMPGNILPLSYFSNYFVNLSFLLFSAYCIRFRLAHHIERTASTVPRTTIAN